MTAPSVTTCEACGSQIAPSLLVCPSCHALTHSVRLKELAAEADRATAAGDLTAALSQWRVALELLPEGTRQHSAVTGKITALGRQVDAGGGRKTAAPGPPAPWWRQSWALLAAAAIFLLTKAKLLLLGLTKAKTLFSMLLFLGVYWNTWGWQFGVAFVLGIYIHEMGHVAALSRYGIQATAPMFIPGLGAVVLMKQHLTDVRQDARVGLAGPIWGFAVALVCYVIAYLNGSQFWYAVAKSTAFINLFNLIPFWQLDGGRAFHALNRGQRITAAIVILLAWMTSEQSILALLLILAVWQVFARAPEEPDNGALGMYAALVLVLAWLSAIPVTTSI